MRGLADGLRSELKPLGVAVHTIHPGNMNTAGYAVESAMKPTITKKIDGASALIDPMISAKRLLAGVLWGRGVVCGDMITELIRVLNGSSVPRPNPVSEVLSLSLLGFIFVMYVAMTDSDVDADVKKDKKA